MRALDIHVRHEAWPLREIFTISRGSKTVADVVVVTIRDGPHEGRGEAVPYARYGETIENVLSAFTRATQHIASGESPHEVLQPGAALNAIDCALWDLEAKRSGVSVCARAKLPAPSDVVTAYTLSLASPDQMAAKARTVPELPLLKLKLGGIGDDARMRAVRHARPDARLIADANEAWTADMLLPFLHVAAELDFETVEQPLPKADEQLLQSIDHLIPITADESVHTARDIPALIGLYDAVNIKLDKAGGLTGALELKRAARDAGMKIMIGSMVATSLAVAPALLLASDAEWTDLDGPLLLARDRPHAITIRNGIMSPADARLWG
jgi:L-alanine-DL-glutamate epimerase-like enolase superfamily enzyme